MEPSSNGAASSNAYEIEEEEEEVEEETNEDLDEPGTDGDDVYVAVGDRSSSMEALAWALRHCIRRSSRVHLVHVFPTVRMIPTGLGMLPKVGGNEQQVDAYMEQAYKQIRDTLQKFIKLCHSYKVKVDIILIEGDSTAKAIVDHIKEHKIKNLIVGTSERKMKKKNSKAAQIHRGAPWYCEVKIICGASEITEIDGTILSSSLSGQGSPMYQMPTLQGVARVRCTLPCPCIL